MNNSVMRFTGNVILPVLVFSAVFGAFLRTLGIHATFLRAESGVYLDMAFSTWNTQLTFIRHYVLASYNGHFTPVVFFAEFIQSKLYATSEAAWFWRQMIVCGMLGTSILWFSAEICRVAGASQIVALMAGIAGAIFFLYQPALIGLVTWPFMVCQLLALSIMVLSGFFLMRYLRTRASSNFAGFIFAAYATMHASGVGGATSIGALIAGAVMIWLMRSTGEIDAVGARSACRFLVIAGVLTGGHTVMMTVGANVPAEAGTPLSIVEDIRRFGWLFVGSLYAGIRELWGGGQLQWPDRRLGTTEAVYGITLLLLGSALLTSLGTRYRATRDAIQLACFALIAYPLTTMVIYVAMITFRLRATHDEQILLSYLVGERYVIFPALYLFIMAGVATIILLYSLGQRGIFIMFIAAFGAIFGAAEFTYKVMPTIWPWTQILAEPIWDHVVAEARAAIAPGKLVRNSDLSMVGVEFKSDLKRRRNLLEHALGCHGCVRFEGD